MDKNNTALRNLIAELNGDKLKILQANEQDLQLAKAQKDDAFVDRMTFTSTRFNAMVESVKQVAELSDIIGQVFERRELPSGITVEKMRIPIGTILMIYESRPNVTIDAASLAIKTGNKIILKGGSEISKTNDALAKIIAKALSSAGLPKESVRVISSNGREEVKRLLANDSEIDLVIPRGSRRLLEFVKNNTTIPTLLHLEGNCHVYVDLSAQKEMALSIVMDAKTQRYGVCNTAESLLVHRDIAEDFLPQIAERLSEAGVEIRGDKRVQKKVKNSKLARESDWSTEYLAPIISVKIVDSLDEAINHINKYGSGHTDSIVTENKNNAERFLREVDSSSVMHNTSTRLADGFEYGLGSEIGSSTGKLHARGPVGQEGLTTYKWIVKSDGITKSGILSEEKT